MKNLKITEQFLTVQGEGKSVGQLAYFIRLAGCNLWCTWCDSMHSVDPQQYLQTATFIQYDAIPKNCNLFVITGGEPLLFDLVPLFQKIKVINPDARIEVETNGTIFPTTSFDYVNWNVSPKLKSSNQKNQIQDDLRLKEIKNWAEYSTISDISQVIFKFVVTGPSDYAEVLGLVKTHNIQKHLVYIMPQGFRKSDHTAEKINPILEFCKLNGFNFSPRLHIMLWDNARGV